MRRICFSVAMSLDGYIAGPNGEYDWIIMDPDIDFAEMMNRFDTILIGRHTLLRCSHLHDDQVADSEVLCSRSGRASLAYVFVPMIVRPYTWAAWNSCNARYVRRSTQSAPPRICGNSGPFCARLPYLNRLC